MTPILDRLNSPVLYLICGAIILFVVLFSVLFMVRAYKAGIAMGMDKKTLNRTIASSATFTLLPSVSILLGVIALSGTLGIPLPWLRLSVIGALHYETSVADIAAKSVAKRLRPLGPDSLKHQRTRGRQSRISCNKPINSDADRRRK